MLPAAWVLLPRRMAYCNIDYKSTLQRQHWGGSIALRLADISASLAARVGERTAIVNALADNLCHTAEVVYQMPIVRTFSPAPST